ncbi:MAG: 4Fe-4S dicluster domain-containing protein [Candidatus Aminicenantes bacterium]|nr:4Fe-4S dicluster domain-containing protein [Candidatus Aminicenantes bacterium]
MNSTGKEKKEKTATGKILSVEGDLRKTIKGLLKKLLKNNTLDAVLVPMKAPETESYAWVLLEDETLLDAADPLPPVMTVQGGRALDSITKQGDVYLKIGALMRPCEIRAAVELYKLNQVKLEHIHLISIDCPGALPLKEYMDNPIKSKENFEKIVQKGDKNEALRPVCQICQHFSLLSSPSTEETKASSSPDTENHSAADLHIGFFGGNGKKLCLTASTSKGKDLLEKLELSQDDSLEYWKAAGEKIRQSALKNRESFNKEWQEKIGGIENFTTALDACINCHNCMRVCPVCYCQQCYFDSKILENSPETYLQRAQERGSLRFPLDTLLFHLGRMSHMVLSCVSCGACEDACPMSVPVSQIFSMVGDQTQKSFQYVPGTDRNVPLPLQSFLKDEFCEVEIPCECDQSLLGKA